MRTHIQDDSGEDDVAIPFLPAQPNDAEKPTPAGDLSSVGLFFTLTTTIVGAGCLGMGFGIQQASFLPGSITLVAMSIISLASMLALVNCSRRSRVRTYRELLVVSYGSAYGTAIDIVLCVNTYLGAISAAVVLGDLLPDLIGEWGVPDLLKGRGMLMILACGLSMLLCCVQLTFLRHTSMVGSLFSFYICAVIIARFWGHAGTHADGCDPTKAEQYICHTMEWVKLSPNLFRTFAIFAVAYNGHYNILPLYHNTKNPDRALPVITVVMVEVFVLYALIGVFGYLTFGIDTESDILKMYSNDSDAFVTIARFGVSILVFCSYPLNFYASRLSMIALARHFFMPTTPTIAPVPRVIEIAVAVVGVPLSFFVAFIVPGKNSLGVVMDYNGALFATTVVFTAPGAILVRLAKQDNTGHRADLALGWFLLIFGVALTVMGVVTTTSALITGDG